MEQDLTVFFKGLADQTRQRIINILLYYPAVNVNDLSEILSVPQSKISRHLAILRHSGWLVYTRRDKWVYYKINPGLDSRFLEALKSIFNQFLLFESDHKTAQKLL
ncbi:MAG TPA: metalloregulator ArsR/SmtB family transcription factor [Caldithrix sp.]|nr:metalloregulator ArsR/SmtB family transcription factor [Caldithrix sp.]